jgi:endonuclease/exonuclease/phosphatase (EEP) superfamily protein YafD
LTVPLPGRGERCRGAWDAERIVLPDFRRTNPFSLRTWFALAVGLLPWTWFLVRDLSPRTDAVALLWPPLAFGVVAALVLAALVLRWPGLLVAVASWLVVSLLVVVLPWRPLDGPAPRSGGIRVVAANTLGSNTRPEVDVKDDLLGERPQLLVVSEITPALDQVLRRQFPHRIVDFSSDADDRPDVGVYSTFALEQTDLPWGVSADRGMRVVVGAPTPFVLYAIHLQKPGVRPSEYEVGFRTHQKLIGRIADAVAAEDRPVVLAGDLNLAERTGGYRTLTGVLDDAMRGGWVGPTTLRPTTRLLLARIDHMLMPEGWCTAGSHTFGIAGSDHRGVSTRLGPCP